MLLTLTQHPWSVHAADVVAYTLDTLGCFILTNWEKFAARVPSVRCLVDIVNRKIECNIKWALACRFKDQLEMYVFVKYYKNMRKATLLERCAETMKNN